MTTTISKLCLAASVGGASILFISGCGQDGQPDSSNRGSDSHTSMTSVENAYIVPRFVPGACALQVGNWADLRFTVTNDRANENETLLAVSTDAARMTRMTPPGGVAINPGARAAFGQPVTEEADSAAQAPAVALAGLDSDARPGTSVDVKFDFKRAGAIKLRVPIEACPTD